MSVIPRSAPKLTPLQILNQNIILAITSSTKTQIVATVSRMKPFILTVLAVACAVFAAPKPHRVPPTSVARNSLTSDDGGYGEHSNECGVVDSDIKHPRSKMHSRPGPKKRATDDGGYGSYRNYGGYGGFVNYSSYSSYKRDQRTAHK